MADQTETNETKTETETAEVNTAEQEAIELSKKFDEANISEEEETTKTDGEENTAVDDKTGKETGKEAKDTKEATTETQEPVIGNDLLDRAKKAGLSVEEAKAYVTPEALTRTLDILDRTQKKVELPPKQEPGKKAEEAAGEAGKEAKEKEKLSFGFSKDEFDEGFVDSMEKFAGNLEQRFASLETAINKIAELEGKLGKVDQVVSQQEQTTADEYIKWYDTKLAALGADYEEAIGKGATAELAEGSEQAKLRDAVMEEMIVVAAGLKATGKAVPARDVLFDRAVKAVLSDKVGNIEAKKEQERIAEQLKKRAKQNLGKPGIESRKELTPEQEAIRISEEFDKKNAESGD